MMVNDTYTSRDISGMGPKHFMNKKKTTTMSDRVILISFLAGPNTSVIQILCSICCKVDIKISCAHHFFLNDPSKFQMANHNLEFCMQMNGTWAIGPFSGPIHILDQKNIPAQAMYSIR